MNLRDYIASINDRYKQGISSEHSYRGDLEALIRELQPNVRVTNEPANVTECGNPDFVITKDQIPIGFIEAKDLGKDLNHKQYKEQFDRYRKALDNLIITDYLWFQFFQNGEMVHEIRIAEINQNKIKLLPGNFSEFTNLIQNFCTFVSQTIKFPQKLAEMMAAKAGLLKNILEKAITSDEDNADDTELKEQYKAFKEVLIHDLSPQDFADIYAQTLAYGMFAARLNDLTLDTFSRQEAAELIPKSNPFLRKLFDNVAGIDIDSRIKTTVDNLADVFRATDIKELLANFGQRTQTNDPIIHFYETFLAEYDPAKRKARGVWYTPAPVVNFIVRNVDQLLKTEFRIRDGLSDTSKTKIRAAVEGTAITKGKNKGKPVIRTKEVHKVQVLDPATGTGTFLAEVIRLIHGEISSTMKGFWSGYVEEDLIPRLNGFELLMASYAMAHLQIDMLLKETGYNPTQGKRLKIFLTDSLQEHHPDTGTLFASWLSNESREANRIKRDSPIMVVLGNPPYRAESTNKSHWIMGLMDDYKKEPGSEEKLKERNPKWINDDYVKFLRCGQHFIEKNGNGILAFINSHSFLDNPTFRGMRWNLLKTYDKIYILDLHGNTKKREVAPDGSRDVNVFDIQQGVSINFFVKTGRKKRSGRLAEVHHYDLYGERKFKYQYLLDNSIDTIPFTHLKNVESPMYFMVKRDFEAEKQYKKGFSIRELFPLNSIGVVTARDKFTIHHSSTDLKNTVRKFLSLNDEDARVEFNLGKDVRDWKVSYARADLEKSNIDDGMITSISYRPFDSRYTYYTGNSKGFHCYPRKEVMQHFLNRENVGLALCRQFKSGNHYVHAFITNQIIESTYISNRTSEIAYSFPLYVYPDIKSLLDKTERREPNLDPGIIEEIVKCLDLNFSAEKEKIPTGSIPASTFAPIDILDYIYAVLHSLSYREKYKTFLKTDFPRIPYPTDGNMFWQMAKLGSELRQIHLLQTESVKNYIVAYPQDGDNRITRAISTSDWELSDKEQQLGRVWINDQQYFDKIPLAAWNFSIGAYRPAQKWLKDRRYRTLTFNDIQHYQKIVVALTEANCIMGEINKIKFG